MADKNKKRMWALMDDDRFVMRFDCPLVTGDPSEIALLRAFADERKRDTGKDSRIAAFIEVDESN